MKTPESLIAIHMPDPPPTSRPLNERLNRWGRPELVMASQELGLEVVFTNGTSAYDFDTHSVDVLHPEVHQDAGGFQVTVTPQTIPIGHIKAIRNMGAVLGHGLPELNHPTIRSFSLDKARLNTVANQLNIIKPFSIWDGGDLASAFDVIPNDEVVIKPRKGSLSKNVFTGTKQELSAKITSGEIPAGGEWIIEGRYSFYGLPVVGIDKASNDLLAVAESQKLPAELRTYYFGRENGRLIKSHVARVAVGQSLSLVQDEWVFIDQDAIPSDVEEQNDRLYDAIAAETGIEEMHIALDSTFVSSTPTDTPAWKPMEVNSIPVLLHSGDHVELAQDQAFKLATQLGRISQVGLH